MDKKKILIVDFDTNAVSSLERFLSELGYEVLTAPDGESGLEKCKQETPDMVIMEPMLPKLHGFELCTIISHDLEPKIPVVILTKFYREEQFKIESLRSFGATAFLSKPYNRNSILALLEEHLGEKVGDAQEQDSLIEKEIPSSISLDSLKSLEEQFKKEELDLIQDENIEKQLLEAVATFKTELPKVEKKTEISVEIDQMLKDTLSEFGLEHEQEDTAAAASKPDPAAPVGTEQSPAAPSSKLEEPEIPSFEAPPTPEFTAPVTPTPDSEAPLSEAEAQEPKPEPIPAETTAASEEPDMPPLYAEAEKPELSDEPLLDSPPPTPKEEERPEPDLETTKPAEEETFEKPGTETFGSMFGSGLTVSTDTDKDEEEKSGSGFPTKLKKPSLQIIIPFAAVVLVIITVTFFMLKPKKVDSLTENTANLVQTNKQPAANALANPAASTSDQDKTEAGDANRSDDSASGSESETAQAPASASAQNSSQPSSQAASPPSPLTTNPASDPAATASQPEASVTDPAQSESVPPQSSIAAGNLPKYLEPTVPAKTTPESKADPKINTTASEPEAASTPPAKDNPVEKSDSAKPEDTPAKVNQPGEKAAALQTQPLTPVLPKAKTGDLVPLKSVDVPPQVLQQELPKYPPIAKNKGISGTVIVNALISETGEIIQTVVIRGIKGPFGFNEASEKAVRKWKFKPAEKDGVKVKVWKQIPFSFKESK